MASPLPLPGMILRASMLSRPYRAWGVLDDGSGTGVNIAALQQTQYTTPNEQVYADRMYRIDTYHNWRTSVANDTLHLALDVDPGTGVFTNLVGFRSTAPSTYAGGSSETAYFTALWTPGVDTAAARFRVVGSRQNGSGTETMLAYFWSLEDVGPA